MISFNLTALTRETPSIQRKVKTREIFSQEYLPNFYPTFIHNFNFQHNQSLQFKNIPSNHGVTIFQNESDG